MPMNPKLLRPRANTETVPGLPVALSVTSGDTQATFSWSAPENDGGSAIIGYDVDYQDVAFGGWNPVGDGLTEGTTVTVGSLSNGTAYRFRVAAVNAVGAGEFALSSNVTPNVVPAGAPTNVSVTFSGPDATVSWDAPEDEGSQPPITSYEVQRTTSIFSGPDANANCSESPYLWIALVPGVEYYFRVAAITNDGGTTGAFSAWSGPHSYTTVPEPPTSASASSGDQEIEVSWSAPESDGGSPITDYVVEYKEGEAGTWLTFSDGVGTSTTATVSSLTNGTTYFFRVSAVNANGTGTATEEFSQVPDAIPPDPPTDLTVDMSTSEQASVSWTEPADTGSRSPITKYSLQISTDAAAASDTVNITTGDPVFTSYIWYSLTDGVEYYFRVAAATDDNFGSPTILGEYTGWSGPHVYATVPETITDLSASPDSLTDDSVDLSWTAPGDGGADITDYSIEYSTDQSSWTSYSDGTSTSTSATVTGLATGTEYWFRVAAVNSVGTAAWSNEPSATPQVVPPGVPTGITVTMSPGQAYIEYTAPTNEGSEPPLGDYSIQISTNGSDESSTETSSSTSHTWYYLTDGTDYWFRVAATNNTGLTIGPYSGWSGPHVEEIAPSQIGDLTATQVNSVLAESIDLSWSAPSDGGSAITGYDVEYSTDDSTWYSLVTDTTDLTASYGVADGATTATTYYFRVRANNSIGSGDWSASASQVMPKGGCTDSGATNYDSTATFDDGSCSY